MQQSKKEFQQLIKNKKMKEISLLANIVVYSSLFIALFYNVTDKIKRNKIEHFMLFVLMLWTLFTSCFLIKNFKAMCDAPLNLKLNIYETITNFLFFTYIIYKIAVEHCKTKDNEKSKNALKKASAIGGGGIKNPKL